LYLSCKTSATAKTTGVGTRDRQILLGGKQITFCATTSTAADAMLIRISGVEEFKGPGIETANYNVHVGVPTKDFLRVGADAATGIAFGANKFTAFDNGDISELILYPDNQLANMLAIENFQMRSHGV